MGRSHYSLSPLGCTSRRSICTAFPHARRKKRSPAETLIASSKTSAIPQVSWLTFDFSHLFGAFPECDCTAWVFSSIFQSKCEWMYFIWLFSLSRSLARPEFSFHTKRNIKEPVDSPVWLCAGCRSSSSSVDIAAPSTRLRLLKQSACTR